MIEAISEIIREQARSKGLTQARLAQDLGVSLPTVKRWFAGKGLSLGDFVKLLELLELDFDDLAAMVPQKKKKSFRYSEEQEEFFADYPHYLSYFDQLLNGRSPEQITAKSEISARSTRRYLKALEELGLIEVHPGQRIRLLVAGEPVWKKNGRLASALKSRAVQDFIQESENKIDLFLHNYTAEDTQKMRRLIGELDELATTANRRAKLTGVHRPYGLMVGLAPFTWKLLDSVEEV